MKPLWKIKSGKFAGWRDGDILYNSDGVNVGFFVENEAYSSKGKYVGEIYENDYIGKKSTIAHSSYAAHAKYANISLAKYADRAGLVFGGWEDPDF